MSEERNYYVLCEDNCKFESMTKEQIIAAIAEATGETPVHIDDAFITKIKEQNHNNALKMWVGTQAQYNAISFKDDKTLYLITDKNEFEDLIADNLTTNDATKVLSAKQGKILGYDYIVERGTTTTTKSQGGTQTWHYEKWNSGKLVAWTEINYENIPCNITYGSLFRTDSFLEEYPSMFINEDGSNLGIQITKVAGDAGMLQTGTGRNFENYNLPSVYIIRGTSNASINFRLSILIIGIWK